MAIAANLAYIALMYASQAVDKNLPVRGSVIPGTRQKFNYMQDFWTMTYGDAIGISLIYVGFAHLTACGYVSYGQRIGFMTVAVVSAAVFSFICLGKRHKPDQCYPGVGKISWNGIIHTPYFGAGVAASSICLWNLAAGNLQGSVMWVTISGGIVYLFCCHQDISSGNWDPLKRY